MPTKVKFDHLIFLACKKNIRVECSSEVEHLSNTQKVPLHHKTSETKPNKKELSLRQQLHHNGYGTLKDGLLFCLHFYVCFTLEEVVLFKMLPSEVFYLPVYIERFPEKRFQHLLLLL